jgi:broad specificity phosphatase PhoE
VRPGATRSGGQWRSSISCILVASHGNLISLVLHALEPGVDFAFHVSMPMPALYRLNHDGVGWRVMGGHGFRSVADDS